MLFSGNHDEDFFCCVGGGVLLSVCSVAGAQGAPSPAEAAMGKSIDAESSAAVELLEKLVDINSGTMDFAGVVRVKDVLQPQLEALGFKVHWDAMEKLDGRAGDLVAEHACPMGTGKCGKRLLLIGHMDTVFDLSSPFQKYEIVPGTNGRVATGPGTCDMKGGLVVMLSSLKAMKAAGVLENSEITIVLSGDEEDAGRPISVSRKDMIDAAMWRWSLRMRFAMVAWTERMRCGLGGGARSRGGWRRRGRAGIRRWCLGTSWGTERSMS